MSALAVGLGLMVAALPAHMIPVLASFAGLDLCLARVHVELHTDWLVVWGLDDAVVRNNDLTLVGAFRLTFTVVTFVAASFPIPLEDLLSFPLPPVVHKS